MLKETALTITPAVTRLFNISIRLGEVPECGKLLVLRLFPSHVITPENYCPISLLSVPSKPLELHIQNLVIVHLEKYCPLSAHLWGFTQSKSTTATVLDATDHGIGNLTWSSHLLCVL